MATQVNEQDQEYYEEEDYEGWIWDEQTQQWVEDPNWVDPNAQYDDTQYYDDQPNNDLNQISNAHQTHHQPQKLNTHSSLQNENAPKLSSGRLNPKILKQNQQREQQLAQTKSAKIDETNIPRVRISNVVKRYECRPKIDRLPPGSRTPFVAQDCGNATPRHVRMTLYNLPQSSDTAEKCSMAIAAVIQPIANIGIEELEIPIVNMGEEGPLRCVGCRGYMNPHVLWIADGTKWICNLCQLTNECPVWYRKNLDGNYQRRDKMQRAELHRGSIDYVAPSNLVQQMKFRPAYFFVIDVSSVAYQRSLVDLTVQCIINSLYELRQQYVQNNDEDDANTNEDEKESSKRECILRVGFLTYDQKIHFHALSNGALHVISEVKDPFVSLPDSEILIDLMDDEKFSEWERLLLRIPKLFESNALIPENENKSCFGAALHSASQVLEHCGGKVFGQQTSLPTLGCGALKYRDGTDTAGTEKERMIYCPADDFYPTLTQQCAANFISVDIFCCSSGYCDLASVGDMTRKTGGQIYYYSNFNRTKDGETFENDLKNDICRKTVFRSVMAVRASKGLEVNDYFGGFFLTENQEIQLPVITSDTTLAVACRHYERLSNSSSDDNKNVPAQIATERNKYAAIQVAMLYLTMSNEVFIRVHTVSLPIVRRIADVFRCVDMDSVLNVSLKQCAQELVSQVSTTIGVAAARRSLVAACCDILFVYRRYCASNNAHKQLVLPEALKLLPLFTLGLMKNPLLEDGVEADERAYHISCALHMPVYQSLTFISPYLYVMHDLSDKEGVVSETGRVLLPRTVRARYEDLESNGLYVMDTARKIYVIIGPDLPKEMFEQCFVQNKSSKHGLKIELNEDFEEDVDDLGYRLSLILEELRYDRPNWLKIEILLLPNTKDHDSILTMDQHEFLKHLIEDVARLQSRRNSDLSKFPETMSYMDFLVYVHKEIQRKFVNF